MPKPKAFSIYPDATTLSKLKIAAEATDRVPSRMAVRLIRAGLRKWERSRSREVARTS